MKTIYIAKQDTWFDEGTNAKYLTPMLCGHEWPALMLGIKDGKVDEESCSKHEFEIIEPVSENVAADSKALKDMIPDYPRKIYGWPIRKSTTFSFYQQKISIDDFMDTIKKSIEPFGGNMKALKAKGPKFIEDWFETFGYWMEIEEER